MNDASILRVVESEADLRSAQQALAAAFAPGATEIERYVNFPGPDPGYPDAKLSWHRRLNVWGFFPDEPRRGKSGNQVRFCSFFGTSVDQTLIAPIVEINLGSHRHPAGRAFIDQFGKLYIGHRGGLGGGRTSMAREPFRAEAEKKGFQVREIVRSDRSIEPVILIARVESPGLPEDIARFVHFCEDLRQQVKAA